MKGRANPTAKEKANALRARAGDAEQRTYGKFDAHTMGLVLGALSAGASITVACSIAEIGRNTYYKHYAEDPAFKAEVEIATAKQDALVVMALFKTAMAGDVQAQKLWLTNRQRGLWSDRKEVDLGLGDMGDLIHEAAERARAKLKAGAVTAEVVDGNGHGDAKALALVPKSGNGNGNGNGGG